MYTSCLSGTISVSPVQAIRKMEKAASIISSETSLFMASPYPKSQCDWYRKTFVEKHLGDSGTSSEPQATRAESNRLQSRRVFTILSGPQLPPWRQFARMSG